MANTYTEFKAVVEFLIKEQRLSLDEAILKSKVPVQFIERLKVGLDSDFVKIKAPSLLMDRNKNKLNLISPSDSDHQPYLNSYLAFLENVRGWDENVIGNLKQASFDIIKRIPAPILNEKFQCRGLVVGHVQSGKTANMAALIARAVDNGYRLIVVFAGTFNDLRAQTQDRMDQDLTGYSESIEAELRVQYDEDTPKWIRYTKSGLEGDFQEGTISFVDGQQSPMLAVIKKRPGTLENFKKWITREQSNELSDFPVLIIDDEADLASIDTNYTREDKEERSRTNQKIYELISSFSKCTYVGFTATPFANILIDADAIDDLYPRDFIAVLDEPANYFGARQLFGLGMSPSSISIEEAATPELNLVRFLTPDELDALDTIEHSAKGSEVINRAILTFVLSSCVRLYRGHNDKHFSMLVHPSHAKAVHEDYKAVVTEEFEFIKKGVVYPKTLKLVTEKAEEIWNSDFMHTMSPESDKPSFETLWKFAKSVVNEIEILKLNSDSGDELDYKSEVPRRYIVIGGNRLSRGLTLEGLSVSLFLRNSKMYDTLFQMGRWFGYRQGYADLTRIFVSEEMADAFADLARVELELREDLKQYSIQENPPTPLEIKPKIRAHPTLSVTSSLKMGRGQRINISLQRSRAETVSFPLEKPTQLKDNQTLVASWLSTLGPRNVSKTNKDECFWIDVPANKIIELIDSYHFGKNAKKTNRAILRNYISQQLVHNELTKWDICLPSGNSSLGSYTWVPGISTNKVNRAKLNSSSKKNTSIRVLSSPPDIAKWRETFGRSADDCEIGGLFLYAIDKFSSSKGGSNKLFDDPKNGVDVIGLVFVFPSSKSEATIEYVTQEDFA
ncbi:Z1 domain-containing protein [Bdellovibrio sp. HCB288]|uniref:Z1 domain-containing protein n=1 Tax=Bdellovibrio sp. HCB288 TaxID=3394355 RepID=UPI0039B62015